MSTIGQIAGVVGPALLGTALEDRRERRQHKNQKDLMSWQKANQMGLNEQGQELQMKTWRETNYPAQMEMLKEAGLNPGLLYGMSGGGGVTTGSQGGGGAAGGQATKGQSMDIGQMALLNANRELIKAQTEKVKAETVKTGGADTDLTNVTIEEKEIANAINEVRNRFEQNTKLTGEQEKRERQNLLNESRILYNEFVKNNADANIAAWEEALWRDTYEEKVKMAEAMTVGQQLKNKWDASGIAPNETTTKQAYKVMQAQGMNDEDIAIALLTAGVAGEIIKTLVPIGIANKYLKQQNKPRTTTTETSTQKTSDGSQSWKRTIRD